MTKRTMTVAAMLALFAGSAFSQAKPGTAKPATDQPKPAKVEAPAKPAEKSADASTLKVGSEAPAWKGIEKWVKGSEVKSFEAGKVYVVEFWATWCGPCKESIPHLTSLAHKFKGVTFIGVAASEHKGKDGKDDRENVLAKFVKDQGDKMDYTVAYDSDGDVSKAWMQAAGQNGIPCAFIVDGQGKIAYIGHPMEDGFESTLAKLAKPEPKKTDEKKADAPKDAKPADKKK